MAENLSLFDQSLLKIEYYFRWSGLHLRNREDYNVKKARFLFWFNFLSLNLDVTAAFWWLAKGVARGNSLVSLTYIAPSIALAFLSDFKSLSYMWYHGHVDKLVYKLRELENKVDVNSNESKTLIESPLNFLHFVLKVSNFFNWLLMVAFPLMPLSITMYSYFALGKVELVLPFFVEYPFDPYDIKIYPFVLLRHIYGEVVVLFWIFATEAFYYICTTFIIIQFRLLQQEIILIIPETSDNRRTRHNEDEVFETKIIKLVKWHQELIDAVQVIDTMYSVATLFNFVSSSAMICLTGFNVTTFDDVGLVVMFLNFLCLSLVQIFFRCFFGDMIMRSNGEVSHAVYNCNWYLTSAKEAKMLYYLQMRAQKPCKLTAYGFADVNMTAFAKILNRSWSYFALLKTVNR